jgi:Na+:H+ antiporter
MHVTNVLIVMVVIASAVAVATRRLAMPYTVGLVVVGIVLGAFNLLQAPHLTRDLLFGVFLPGLVFEAAYQMPYAEFRKNRMAVLSLAVPGVIAGIALTATLVVALARVFEPQVGFGWKSALAFGGAVAATDPIAVVAMLRQMGAPTRLNVLLEGESLLNDGTGIVFFSLIIALTTSNTSPGWLTVSVDFLEVVGIGLVIGILFGWISSQLMRRVQDATLVLTLTAVAAYGSFAVADQLGGSGVIATVVAGMICGNYGESIGMSIGTRLAVRSFWGYIAFLLNSLIFLLIGMEIHLGALQEAFPMIAAAFLAGLASRVLVVGSVAGALSFSSERIPPSWMPAVIWGGLRGGLSMVLALSLPDSFPGRQLVITMTFGVVIMSILINGLTMAPLLRFTRVVGEHQVATGELDVPGEAG